MRMVIMAPFHHFQPDLAFSGRSGTPCATGAKKAVVSSSSIKGIIAAIASIIARNTSHSLPRNT